MKRKIFVLSAVFISAFIISFWTKPIILYLAKKQIRNVFLDSRVSIGGCNLRPLGLLTFSDIEIKKEPIYDFKIKKVRIYYRFDSLLRKTIPKIYIEEGSLNINGFHLKGVSLKIEEETRGGLYIKEAVYSQIKLEDIKSSIGFKEKRLTLDSLSAKSFDGQFLGDFNLNFNKNIEYILNLKVLDLNLETFIRDFKMGERFQINGRLGGNISLKGKDFNIDFLNGDFSTYEPGGRLTIKDKRFLKTIAKNTKQSLDILIKGFEDYRYTTGSIRLSLEDDNLILNIALDGEAGKRNLTIVVHDIGGGL